MSPFASTAFRWLWSATLVSATAGGLERTATGWLALEAGGGAFGVGLVLSARMLPSLLLGLAAGTLADRIDRKRQLAAVAITAVPLMALLAWLAATSTVHVWQIVVISFAAGCLQVFDITARQTLIVDSLPRELASNGVAMIAFVSRLALAAGAFGAGALISSLGVASCYVLVAVAYAITAVLVLRVRIPSSGRPSVAHPPFHRALRDAARLIVDVPALRTLVAAGVACEIFGFSHPTAVPVVARDVLNSGAEGLGILNASISVGGTLGVLLLSQLPSRMRREPVLGVVYVIYGVALMGFALAPSLALASLALVVTGACAGSFDALQQTLMQLAVPDEQRGRAMGVWVLGIGSAPLGHLETGALVAAVGAPYALLVNGSCVLLGAVVLLARAPLYRAWSGLSASGPSTYPPPSR